MSLTGLKEPCYIGIAPCGCTLFAVVDRPQPMKDAAREIAQMLRDGWRLERVEADYVRKTKGLFECPHLAVKKSRKKAPQ